MTPQSFVNAAMWFVIGGIGAFVVAGLVFQHWQQASDYQRDMMLSRIWARLPWVKTRWASLGIQGRYPVEIAIFLSWRYRCRPHEVADLVTRAIHMFDSGPRATAGDTTARQALLFLWDRTNSLALRVPRRAVAGWTRVILAAPDAAAAERAGGWSHAVTLFVEDAPAGVRATMMPLLFAAGYTPAEYAAMDPKPGTEALRTLAALRGFPLSV